MGNYEHLGCFKNPSNSKTSNISSLESVDALLSGSYKNRKDAVLKCAKAAYRRGYDVFALQEGGKCLTSASAGQTYSRYGVSSKCGLSGKGGKFVSDVYRITESSLVHSIPVEANLNKFTHSISSAFIFHFRCAVVISHNAMRARVCSMGSYRVVCVRLSCRQFGICPWSNVLCKWKTTGAQFIKKEEIAGEAKMAMDKSTDIPVTVQLWNKGTFSSDSSISLRNSLMICFWVKCDHPGFSITLTAAKNNPLLIKHESCNLIFTILGENVTAEHCTCNHRWHHLCFTWKSSTGAWEIYINGQLNQFGRAWNRGKEIPVLRRITLEYKMQYSNSSNDPLSFTGLNIWKEIHTPEEVLRMSYGCGGEGLYGTIISWRGLQTKMKGSYQLTNEFSCLIEKGAFFMNSSSQSTLYGMAELSQWFNRSATGNGKCMKFRYIIFGTGSKDLRILQTIPEVGEKLIWIDDVTTSPVYNYGEVSLGTVSKSKITIRGGFQTNSAGFIAIGGLYFTNGYCESGQNYAEKACSTVLTNLSGIIVSPLYPAIYPPKSTCTWHIRVPKGLIVRLSAVVFELPFDQLCNVDYIAVYDGPSRDLSPMIGRYCYKRFPVIESSSNNVTLIFSSAKRLKQLGWFIIKYSTKVESPRPKLSARCPSGCKCYYISGESRIVVEGKSLSVVPGNIPHDTAVVLFAQNSIQRIKTNDFSSKRFLEYIDISRNKMLYIDSMAFNALESLQNLKLTTNFLRSLNKDCLFNLSSLQVLDLAENLIDQIHPDAFSTLINLRALSLRSNHIFHLDPRYFRGNFELQYLYLQHNEIMELQEGVFKYLKKLKVLYLNDNKIKQISANAFQGLESLQILHLRKNKFAVVPYATFSYLKKLEILEVDFFMLCCYAEKFTPKVYCDAPADEFSNCDDLMKIKAARFSVWLLGILAFFGNICVVAWRLTLSEDNRVQSLLLTNLAVSDFLMGVYLLIIAIKDAQWQNVYFTKDFDWRNGLLCKLTGALSMLSSEVSVLMLTIITADRLKSIVYPLHFGKLSYKSALAFCFMAWVIGLLVSFLPITDLPYFYDVEAEMGFYGRSSVCLPLQLSTSRLAGWEFSVTIFIAFNLAAFVFIFCSYVAIFVTVKTSSARTKSKNAKKEAAMAWKVMAIILTDFCCWMPVIIIGILSLSGIFHDPQGLVYVWIAVFVLPVNSSINPILYTFCNADVRQKITTYLSSRSSNRGSTSTQDTAPAQSRRSEGDKVTNLKLKLKEVSPVFHSEKDAQGKVYLTCLVGSSESLWLLKCFTTDDQANWLQEVNVFKTLQKDGRQHENLISFKWHGKAKELEIETNNIKIPGNFCLSDCSFICFGFSTKYIPLIKFLEEPESTLNVENLSLIVLDVLKAVEMLHRHGVSHKDISTHNVLVEQKGCDKVPPITAILGGFDKAKVFESEMEADQAIKEDTKQVINLAREIFTICGFRGELKEVSNAIETCFQETPEWTPRIRAITNFFKKALDDGGDIWESKL